MNCKHYDNWCEEEKRTCNNCYYERGDNMSDEEKKAIHLLQSYAGMTHKLTDNQGRPKLDKAIDIVLNLIEKQQKEIEELKEKSKKCEYYEMVTDELYKNSISKDKIKAKIEELNDLNSPFAQRVIKAKELYLTELVQNILQELLEKE